MAESLPTVEYVMDERLLSGQAPGTSSFKPQYDSLLPESLRYGDMVRNTGMSWSEMLKETSNLEFQQLSSLSSWRPTTLASPLKQARVILPKLAVKKRPYNWTRTEQLTKRIGATDRPYRSTYGDRSSSPSRLYLSTDYPIPEQNAESLSHKLTTHHTNNQPQNQWISRRHIEKIYKLLHSGDTKQLSRIHIFTHKTERLKKLPTVLPEFQIQLCQSINQVLLDEEDQPEEVISEKRPMTSEKIIYYPITEQRSNPDLLVSKSGKVTFRDKPHKETYKRLTFTRQPTIISQEPDIPKRRPATPPSPEFKAISKMSNNIAPANNRLTALKQMDVTARSSHTRKAVGFQSKAEGFQFSVKITPKQYQPKQAK